MKNVTKFSIEVQKELNKNLETGSIISLIIGSVGLLIYIVLGVAIMPEPQWLDYLLYVAAVLFGFGLVFLLSVKKTNKNANVFNVENQYEFFEEYFTIDSTKNGEQIATVKTYYNEVYKVKETANYLFIFQNQYTSYPVIKNTFSQEELYTLKERIEKGVKVRKAQVKRNKNN